MQGKLPEAVASYQQALRLRPDSAATHYSLGSALQVQGKFAEAAASYREALRLRPDYVEALNNLGNTLREQGQLSESVASFERAMILRPQSVEAYINLAAALQDQGKRSEAADRLEQALRLRPDFAEARYNRSMLWLLQGNFEQGWPEYENRWRLKDDPASTRSLPRWDGSSLAGKTILLFAEQGMGDTLQFIRYSAVVKERGAKVVAEVPPALMGVLAGCPGIDQLVPQGDPLPPCDLQAALMSLPGLCGTTLASIPAMILYLVTDPSRVAHWRGQLASVSGFKVGICWQGNPAYKHDRRRSVLLAQFAPLAEIPGICLVNLQRGPGGDQWDAIARAWPTVDLIGLAQEPHEAWMESAALICALDLVITVDTAVAHLAGALGKPVWVALPFSPDWRWLLEREDSPWYPTLRLFRQTQPEDWPGVFQRIRQALTKQLAESADTN
jgi:hypothetical protein